MSDEQKVSQTNDAGSHATPDSGLSNTWKTVILGLVILAAGAVASHRIMSNSAPNACGTGGCGGCGGGSCPAELAAIEAPGCCPSEAGSVMAMPADAPQTSELSSCCPADGSGGDSGCCPSEGSASGCAGCSHEAQAGCSGCEGGCEDCEGGCSGCEDEGAGVL